jgi:hypothetical protein
MSSSGLPQPPGQHGHWLLPTTVQPQDIDGLVNFSRAIMHDGGAGCWGKVHCECPFNPTYESPEEWQDRVFDCLWRQGFEPTGPEGGRDLDLPSQNILPNSGLCLTVNSEEYGDAEVHEDGGEHENGQPCEIEKAHGNEEAGGPDADLIRNYADAQFGGNLKKAEASLVNLRRNAVKMAWWSPSNSETKDSDAGLSVASSKKVNRQDGTLSTASQKSSTYKSQGQSGPHSVPSNPSPMQGSMNGSRKAKRSSTPEGNSDDDAYQPPLKRVKSLEVPPSIHSTSRKSQGRSNGTLPPKNLFTTHCSIEGSHKRKRTPELEDYLDDEVDQPPTKKGKVKTQPPKTSRKANDGASVQPSRDKGFPWSRAEGDELFRLIVDRRKYEKDHNQTALHDAKLFEELSPLHNRTFPKEKRSLGACKNYWNRHGRVYYGYDERGEGKRSDSMVTSAQPSKAQKVKQQTKTKRKTRHHFKGEKSHEDENEE